MSELIETTLLEKGDCEDIEIAKNALADDNAPAVLRALSRIEADSIEIEVEDVILMVRYCGWKRMYHS